MSRVVKGGLLAVTKSPVTTSRPEKTMLLTKLGDVPIWPRDGVREIWKETSLAAEEKPEPEESAPISQVTMLEEES